MIQTVHPYFHLSGEFNPDDITQILEIEPSWVARIGDPGAPGAVGLRRGAIWAWQPEDDDSDDVGDQLAFMAGSLTLKRDAVASLAEKFSGTIYVFHLEPAQRAWFTSANTLQKLADLKVDIGCESVSLVEIEVENDAN